MKSSKNIFHAVKHIINSNIGDNVRVAAICDATDDIEIVTRWKRGTNNPKYTTRKYVTALLKTGFITRLKRGIYHVNAPIPDWCDLGVIWYAMGYERYEKVAGKLEKMKYHGKTAQQWRTEIGEYISSYMAKNVQPEQPKAEAIKVTIIDNSPVAPVVSNEHNDGQNIMVTAEFSKRGKLTDEQWVILTKLFVNYCHDGQRAGQAYMNALRNVNVDVYNNVASSDADCFYKDDKIVAFIQYLNDERPMNPQAKLGNAVVTKRHRTSGIVYQVHHNFAHTNENMDWFRNQRPAIDTNELRKPWVSILVDGGGSILVPMSDIAEITAIHATDNANPWYSFYFNV